MVDRSHLAGGLRPAALVAGWIGGEDRGEAESKAMAVLATMVGAVLFARAVNDKEMSRRFLQAAAGSVTAQAVPGPLDLKLGS